MWLLYITLYTIITLIIVFLFYLLVIGFSMLILHFFDSLEHKKKSCDQKNVDSVDDIYQHVESINVQLTNKIQGNSDVSNIPSSDENQQQIISSRIDKKRIIENSKEKNS